LHKIKPKNITSTVPLLPLNIFTLDRCHSASEEINASR